MLKNPSIQEPMWATNSKEYEVFSVIQKIASDELELTRPVQPADDFIKDLALDSMGLIVLAVGIEDRFHVKLSETDASARTVAELVRLVANRISEQISP